MSSQNLIHNVKQPCIFHLILVGIPSSLILYVKQNEKLFVMSFHPAIVKFHQGENIITNLHC